MSESSVHNPRWQIGNNTYTNHGCRCPNCTTAHSLQSAVWRAQSELDHFVAAQRREANRKSQQKRRAAKYRDDLLHNPDSDIEAAIAFCQGDLSAAARRCNRSLDRVQEVWDRMDFLTKYLNDTLT